MQQNKIESQNSKIENLKVQEIK